MCNDHACETGQLQQIPKKIMFCNKTTFNVSGKLNERYTSGNKNTLMQQWSTLKTAPKLMRGVTYCTGN
jgi:hypothetical protein